MNKEYIRLFKDLIKQLEDLGVNLDWKYENIVRYLRASNEDRKRFEYYENL
jgi:predicted hydrolase (HD superfamily)